MTMQILCIYRGCEMQGRDDNVESHYYSQTETAINNKLYFLMNNIGNPPNR